MKQFATFFVILFFSFYANAQLNGFVFRDYNGNGVVDTASSTTTSAYYERGVNGIIVKTYDGSDLLISTATTNANGFYSFSAIQIPAGTSIRVEFTLPTSNTGCLSKLIDYTSPMGTSSTNSLSSVQFVTAGAGIVANYAINNPEEYNTNLNPTVFVPQYRNGNPLLTTPPFLGAIISQDSSAFLSFPYNSTGLTNQTNNTVLAPAKNIGSTWGVAYSKQSNAVFTSAILKRHTGLGRGTGNFLSAPGAIYLIKPGIDNGTFFTTLDSTLWGAPFYTHNRGTTSDALHVQSNTTRGLTDIFGKANDARVFDQIGKVGIGGLEISTDGRYLYTINMYSKELIRIDLQTPNNPTKPTSTSHFTRYTLPSVTTIAGATDASRGTLRPWALKFYRGKLYIGAVMDASTSGTASHLKAYVLEFDTSAATFTTILNSSLSYTRSTPFVIPGGNTIPCPPGWFAWSGTFQSCNNNGSRRITSVYPQPMLTDIEFDNEGAMLLSFSDRNGYQGGVGQLSTTSSFPTVFDTYVSGDILRAYRKTDCLFEFESNAKEGLSSSKPATTGAGNNQGPANGEFYIGDGTTDNGGGIQFHPDNSGGSLAYVPGLNHIMNVFVDPIIAGTNGTAKLHNTVGTILVGNSYQTYNTVNNIGTHHKIHGLGDLEIVKPVAPIEIGNRVWYDVDYNGIQEPGEGPIAGVQLTLYTDPNGDGDPADGASIGVTTTDVNGNWIFSSALGTSTSSRAYNLNIQPFTNYIVRVTNATMDTLGNLSTDFITGDSYTTIKTISNVTGNGEADWSDNDGVIFWKDPSIYAYLQAKFTTGKAGENNHTIDFGLATVFFILNNKSIYLKASIENDISNLQWEIENKSIVKKYTIERSIDGINFVAIQNITDQNKTTLQDDINSLNIKYIYYRVKLTETNNRYLYSNIVKLQKQHFVAIQIVGNPVKNHIPITITNSSNSSLANFTLYTMFGEKVFIEKKQLQRGIQNVTLQLNNIPNGMYTLQVITEKNTFLYKVIVQH